MINKTQSKSKENTKKYILIMLIFIGVLLIIISYMISEKEGSSASSMESSQYAASLENRLSDIIEKALGLKNGCVDVMITVESKSIDEDKTVEQTTVFLKEYAGANETKEIQEIQEIKGVMIVLSGETNKSDFEIIRRAASTALGISQSKIYIIGGAEQK